MANDTASASSSNGRRPFANRGSAQEHSCDSPRPRLPHNSVDLRPSAQPSPFRRQEPNIAAEVYETLPRSESRFARILRCLRPSTQYNRVTPPGSSFAHGRSGNYVASTPRLTPAFPPNVGNTRFQPLPQAIIEPVRPVPSDRASEPKGRPDMNVDGGEIQPNNRNGLRLVLRRQDLALRTAGSGQLANDAPPVSRTMPCARLNVSNKNPHALVQPIAEPQRTIPPQRAIGPNKRPELDTDDIEIQPNPPKRMKLTARKQDIMPSSRNSMHTGNPSQPDQVKITPQQEQPSAPLRASAARPAEARSTGPNIPHALELRIVASNVPCEICYALFCDAAAVERHKRSQHPPERPLTTYFQCQICKIMLKTKYNFLRHLRIHGDDAFLPCSECDAWFTSDRSRSTHKRVAHGENKLKSNRSVESARCPVLGCNYSSKGGNIKRHFESVHLQLRKHECDVLGCSYRANSRVNLEAHKTTHRNYKRC